MAPRINQPSTHILEEEPQPWQLYHQLGEYHLPNLQINILNYIYPCPVSEGPKESHLGGVWRVVGRTLPHWRPMWGPSDQDGTRKGCPKLHWSHQPWQRTATSAPAPPERQRWPAEERGGSAATATGNRLQLASPGSSRPFARGPGAQGPMLQEEMGGGIMPRRPGGGGYLYGLFQALREATSAAQLSSLLRAHPDSPCNQLAQGHLRQLKQQPQASGLRDGGGGWGWRVTLGRCGGSGVGGLCLFFV